MLIWAELPAPCLLPEQRTHSLVAHVQAEKGEQSSLLDWDAFPLSYSFDFFRSQLQAKRIAMQRKRSKRDSMLAAGGTGENMLPAGVRQLQHPPNGLQNRQDSWRITEWQGLEGTSVGHPVQPSCQSRVTYSRL